MRDLTNHSAYFVSDTHIRPNWERSGENLLRFFRHLDGEDAALFLVGDIFDLWISSHRIFARQFAPFVEALRKLGEQGVPIFYFEGNHDFHIEKFWRRVPGVTVIPDSEQFRIQGRVLQVEHGDFINPDDTAYLRWRKTSRGLFFTQFAHRMPGWILQKIGDTWMNTNKELRKTRPLDDRETIRKMIRTYGEKTLSDNVADVLIAGHMHVKDEHTFETSKGPKTSFNLGTWFNHQDVLKLKDGQFHWVDVNRL